MFIGSFKYSMDSKGRVSIPAKLRKFVDPKSNDAFVMTRGTTKCIDVYPMNTWEELVQSKLNNLNSFEPQEAMFLRMFLQQAAEDKLDTQSRLLIPKNLLSMQRFKKKFSYSEQSRKLKSGIRKSMKSILKQASYLTKK